MDETPDSRSSPLLPSAMSLNPAFSAEGKWTPAQVLELDPAWLKQQGLQIPPANCGTPNAAKGLLSGVISTGGCSAAFISPTGLFLTNHHCLFAIVQEHSTPQRDLITHGFLAQTAAKNYRSKTARVTIPSRFTDVTADILSAIPANADDLARYRAIETKQTQIVAACEKQPGHRCRVAAFDGGVQYQLIDTLEIADVRLVYAPPRSVGRIRRRDRQLRLAAAHRRLRDRPRLRRTANPSAPVPFPALHRGRQTRRLRHGDGLPGADLSRPHRAAEMAERRKMFESASITTANSSAPSRRPPPKLPGQIAVASHLKSLNNTFKNAQGQLLGLERGRILAKQEESEREVLAWAAALPTQGCSGRS
jgi:hypothetical protein